MLDTLKTLSVTVLLTGAVCATQAQAAPKLSAVLNKDMLGAHVPYFESVAGMPYKIEPSYYEDGGKTHIYRIEGCTLEASVHDNHITGFGMDLSPTCRMDLDELMGDFGPDNKNAKTLGDYMRGMGDSAFTGYINCLEGCGNASDPSMFAIWSGPRAYGFGEVQFEIRFIGDEAIDAAHRVREVINPNWQEDLNESASARCYEAYSDVILKEFANVAITRIDIPSGFSVERSCY